MSRGLGRWLSQVLCASLAGAALAVVGLAVVAASPAAAEELSQCQPGYEYSGQSCDAGNGWTYNAPVFDPPGGNACGVYVLRNQLSPTYHIDSYYYRVCGPVSSPVCITWVNPLAALQSNSSGRQYAGTYTGGHLGGDATYLDHPELVNDTIDPGSIFTRTLRPGQACAPGLEPPYTGAPPGPGGTDPDAPPDPSSTPDPCDGANARCNTDDPDGDGNGSPPHVTVFGQVVAPVNTGAANRPLSGARYELWYFGRDGGAGSPLQWRPVLEGVGANHQPAGVPIVGYLNDDGSYRLDFVYPQTYRLKDGSLWEGCPLDTFAPAFLRSKACYANDVQLRIFPKNAAGTVVVKDVLTPAGAPLVAHQAGLGRFYERVAGQQVSVAVSEHAMAYRAVLNARTLWPGLSSYPRIEATIDDSPSPEGNVTGANTFRLYRASAGNSVAEHEVAHLVARHVYGGQPAGSGCQPHFFTQKCDNNGDPFVSGWWEGLANFLAVHAEQPALDTRYVVNSGWIDLEACQEDTGRRCDPGGAVEGNVSALLWDLVDTAAEFNQDLGVQDAYSTSLSTVLQVIRQNRPVTADEFWADWKAAVSTPGTDDVRFLNRLGLTYVNDAADFRGQGAWAVDNTCATCALGDYIYSTTPQSSYRWDFDGQFPADGLYDIWIRLPQGQNDASAVAAYRVPTANGIEEILVDQFHATDGWVNLKPAGFHLRAADDNYLELRHSQWDLDGTLVADGFILSPHPVS